MTVKKIVSLFLALLLLSGLALADSVVGESGDSWVRSGPGRDYTKLTTLEEGESCEFLGSTSTDERGVVWYRVRCDDVDGWVSSRYTVLVGSTSDWSDGWGDDDGYWEGGDTRYVRATGGVVNVRSGPGVSYEDVGTLARGECLPYLNETRYDAGGQAWYKAQYYSYGEVWVSAVYSELTYTRTEASVDDEAGTYGRYIQATGQLNVRSGPGLHYSELGMLKNGATAAYLGEHSTDERGVTWYKVSYNGGSGWVSSRYCTLH